MALPRGSYLEDIGKPKRKAEPGLGARDLTAASGSAPAKMPAGGGSLAPPAPATLSPVERIAPSSSLPTPAAPGTPETIYGYDPTSYYRRPVGPLWQDLLGRGFNVGSRRMMRRQRQRLPGWLQGTSMFPSAIGNIEEILASRGAVSPEVLNRAIADVETGRQQGHDAVDAWAAGMGLTPDHPLVVARHQQVEQGANTLGSERLRDYEIMQEERLRSDLSAINPFLSFFLQLMHPRSAGAVSPGIQGGSQGPNTVGALASLLGNLGGALLERG